MKEIASPIKNPFKKAGRRLKFFRIRVTDISNKPKGSINLGLINGFILFNFY
jgi:hypothetical protein